MTIAGADARQAILDGLALLWEPGGTYELRVLNTTKKTVSGYFRDPEKFALAAAHWSGRAPGAYMTINPVEPSLLARASDRVLEFARVTTSDTDIVRRRWLPLDFDPVRPAGISATDSQHDAAIERAVAGAKLLVSAGIPRDSIVLADSGNGGHLLIRIDLPNTDEATQLVRHSTEAISLRLSDDEVKCDLISFNAARIWKVYGSLACKGDNLPDFPHRVARILKSPDKAEIAPHEVLVALAAQAPPTPPARTSIPAGQRFNIDDFIARNLGGTVEGDGPWNGGRKWVLVPCPFNAEHTDRSAVIVEHASGALAFKCHHNSCIGKSWSDVRELFEPRELRDLAPVREVAPANGGSNGNGNVRHPDRPVSVAVDEERFALTDVGNGKRFAVRHGADMRYCAPEKTWYVYDGTRFLPDDRQQAFTRAKETVRSMHDESRNEPDQSRSAALAKHALGSENMGKVKAMLEAAQSEVPITPSDWDRDVHLLNCINGTLDLRSFELRPHDRADLLTKRTGVARVAGEECPLFLAFLSRVMNGSLEKIAYLQRFFGYALTGLVREHIIVFFYGVGRNGKSVLVDVIHHVLGDYAATTDPSTIMKRDKKEQTNDVARLRNIRFVSSIELDEGERMAESHVKQMTGGDRIVARPLYKEYVEFAPTFKICISSNHMPMIKGNDPAIWARIHLVPFTVVIPESEQDMVLKEKLRAESAGILNWMIEGCREWQRIGLSAPREVRAATDDYRKVMDILEQFLEERCVRVSSAWVLASDLYHAYVAWCEDHGYRNAPTQTRFGMDIAKLGFAKGREKTTSRRATWEGVGLLYPDSEKLEGLTPPIQELLHEEDREKVWEKGSNPSTTPPIDEETF
jgi:P4 family phage/plasmid primase-like protien